MKSLLTCVSLLLAVGIAAGNELVANLTPTSGSITKGVVTMEEKGGAVVVSAIVTGLAPGSVHGIHIHEFGDITALDASSAGGHYNPADGPHGLPGDPVRHAGDLGNIVADDKGIAVLRMQLSPQVAPNGVDEFAGRALIIHASRDTGAQPTGDAGPRIAAGVLGRSNPESEPFSTLTNLQNPERYQLLVTGNPKIENDVRDVGEALEETGEAIVDGVETAAEETGKALQKIGKAIDEELSE